MMAEPVLHSARTICPRATWKRAAQAALVVVAALVLIRLAPANAAAERPDGIPRGHQLAEAWCKSCHAIDAIAAGSPAAAPDFAAIANQPSTTELALKVFLRSSHRNMPNLVLTPDEADELVSYILSLKHP